MRVQQFGVLMWRHSKATIRNIQYEYVTLVIANPELWPDPQNTGFGLSRRGENPWRMLRPDGKHSSKTYASLAEGQLATVQYARSRCGMIADACESSETPSELPQPASERGELQDA